MSTVFIVNPAAGHGSGLKRFRKHAGKDWKVLLTERPGDGARLARRAMEEEATAIVAVGGDGTLGEVVDGYLSATDSERGCAALGTWPAGSGCDFARHYKLKGDADWLHAMAAGTSSRRLDAAVVDYRGFDGSARRRYFLNLASCGLAGEVALKVQAWGKPLGGTATYLAASLAAVLTAKPRRLAVTIDGKSASRSCHLVAVANTSLTGGGMRIAPAADAEDGLLDLVIVEGVSRARLLRLLPGVYSGSHAGKPGIETGTARCVALEGEGVLNIDGEAAGTLPARFEVLPKSVPFLLG